MARTATNKTEVSNGPSTGMFMLALVLVTALGGGGGFFHGMQVAEKLADAAAGMEQRTMAGKAKGSDGGSDGDPAQKTEPVVADHEGARLVKLDSIITNLAAPKDTWIRLEASVVLKGDPEEQEGVMTAKVTDDLVAFLRTVRLAEIEGASGFQYLREDLAERAKARSHGKITEFVIRAMIVE